MSVLTETGLEPRYLELELTESAIMRNAEEAITMLAELTALGIGIAIDDFGTGYSSLAYLKRFPVDRLKIDRSFVADIGLSGDDETITSAIIALAHSLEMQVIAEGVETSAQLDFLKERACDEMQGFYFSRPMPTMRFPGCCKGAWRGSWRRRDRPPRPPCASTHTAGVLRNTGSSSANAENACKCGYAALLTISGNIICVKCQPTATVTSVASNGSCPAGSVAVASSRSSSA